MKFRVSNHKLMIELGRYQTDPMPRETRLCPLCKSNQVENETHFLLQCSKYSLQRQTFLNRINEIIPNIERKSTSESIKLLMNSNDYHVNKLVVLLLLLPLLPPLLLIIIFQKRPRRRTLNRESAAGLF